MYNPITVLSQFLQILDKNQFDKFVEDHKADKYSKTFTTWNQLVVMMTAQLKGWESLREVKTGFETKSNKLYHLGIEGLPKRSNLAYANSKRSFKIYQSLFNTLLTKVIGKDSTENEFGAPLNILDNTTVDLCLSLFPWANFRKTKGALKVHTSFSYDNQIPTFLNITDGKVTDSLNIFEDLSVYRNTIVTFDKGFLNFEQFKRLDDHNVIFITRIREDIKYKIIGQHAKGNNEYLIDDCIIELTGSYDKYPKQLRLVVYWDRITAKTYKFLTNDFERDALTIAKIYKARWDIELFFKWIKQNLKIKTFLGTSRNAVMMQIWIAMIVYLLIWYVAKQSKHIKGILELTRILREMLFENISIIDLLAKKFRSELNLKPPNNTQLILFKT